MKPVLRSCQKTFHSPSDLPMEVKSAEPLSQEVPYYEKMEMRVGRVSPLAFSLMLALGTAIITVPAHASNIQADPSAPKNQQPIVAQTANGLPQVNIQTPTSAGVSVNQYRQFDVDNKGAILNNSRRNTQTQLGGWIKGNPFLATGEARVIVNQVNSANPSLLNGYIEVGGQRAEVVLANPAGIQVNGGGFINASSATLTTGTPFIRSGQVDQYLVRDGKISIKGKGLDAKDTDFTRILSHYVEADAPVLANDLQVVAGSNDVATDGSVSAQKATTTSNRAVAIDTGELGGMYANKITLISTENNQRIDNKGQIFAQAGGVKIDANGQLSNSGVILASDNHTTASVHLNSQSLDNRGSISAQGELKINSEQSHNSGLITTNDELKIRNKGNFINTGEINAERLDIQSHNLNNQKGRITQTGSQSLALETGALQNHNNGTIGYAEVMQNSNSSSPNNQNPTYNQTTNIPNTATGSGSVNIAPSITAPKVFTEGVIAITDKLDNDGGAIYANGGINLNSTTGLYNQGRLNFNQLNVSGQDFDNHQGQLNAHTLNSQTQTFNNQNGLLQVAQNMTVQAQSFDNSHGILASGGTTTIRSKNLQNQNGSISAMNHLTAEVEDTLSNQNGTLIANQNIQIQSRDLNNQAGKLISVNQAIDLNTTGKIQNQAGLIQATQDMHINTQGLNNQEGLVQAKNIHLNNELQSLDNQSGQIVGMQNINISSGTIQNTQGKIVAQQDLTLNSTNHSIQNKDGAVHAARHLNVQSGDLLNQAGSILAGEKANLKTQSLDNQQTQNSGGIYAKELSIQGTELHNQKGSISAVNAIIDTGNVNNQEGQFIVSKDLTLTAKEVNNQKGSLLSGQSLTAKVAALNNQQGEVQASHHLSLTSQNEIDNTSGLLSAGGNSDIQAHTIHNRQTQGENKGIVAQNLILSSQNLNNQQGKIASNTNTTLFISNQTDNTQGQITAINHLMMMANRTGTSAQSLINQQGELFAGKQLTINTKTLNNQDGLLQSLIDTSIDIGGDYAQEGTMLSGNNTTLKVSGQLTNQGKLQAVKGLTVSANNLTNTINGEISATQTKIDVEQQLHNRGLIDGEQTIIHAKNLQNMGENAKIYGNYIAITADSLENTKENDKAATIAARERMDLGVKSLFTIFLKLKLKKIR